MIQLLEKILLQTQLPTDVIVREILPCFSLKDVFKTFYLNKYFNCKCEIFLKNTKKIQKSYRQHRIPANGFYTIPFFMTYNVYRRFVRIQKKELYYRYYIVHYPMERLINYPEYLVGKTSHYYNSDIREKRWVWLCENMPPIQNRTRKDILRFFVENNISVKDFVNTGW